MATVADAFAVHCVELLAALGPASARRMFGGHGVYLQGVMVGLVAGEQLYLKTDAQSLPAWRDAGGRPFVYASTRDGVTRTAAMSYWTPPEDALESADLMQPWARLALAAALRGRAAPGKPSTGRTRSTAARRRARPARKAG